MLENWKTTRNLLPWLFSIITFPIYCYFKRVDWIQYWYYVKFVVRFGSPPHSFSAKQQPWFLFSLEMFPISFNIGAITYCNNITKRKWTSASLKCLWNEKEIDSCFNSSQNTFNTNILFFHLIFPIKYSTFH